MIDINRILCEEFKLKPFQVENTVKLIDEGNTIPFIARYRKEQTGSLDDVVLRDLFERLTYLRNLELRKEEVLRLIEEQGKLTEELKKEILNADVLQRVEDLYRPYRQKKSTRASKAKEKGLEPLAQIILAQDINQGDLDEIASPFIDEEKGVNNAKEAYEGACDIIAEMVSDNADYRKFIREAYINDAILISEAVDEFSLITEGGREIKGKLPKYKMPHVKKNTSGYYNKPGMDMIDLFIGSDGTLGIISEIEIELNKTFDVIWGLTIFMPDEDKALDLVRALRHEIKIADINLNINPSAIEFFSHKALKMLRDRQKTSAFSNIQELKDTCHTAVYIEIESDSNELVWAEVEKLGDVINALGGDEEETWVAYNPINLEKLHDFRHACPECVNLEIDQIKKLNAGITKLGTDMSVPDDKLKDVMKMYNEGMEENKLDGVIFGHIGNNHLHVNIIPKDMDEYEKGKELFLIWAEKIAAMGGAVSAEHGVGKLKVPFLKKMYTEEEINEMRKLKKIFDPSQILNRGTIFEYVEGQ
jgi:hypothetical protein